jgi:hypothetical protein
MTHLPARLDGFEDRVLSVALHLDLVVADCPAKAPEIKKRLIFRFSDIADVLHLAFRCVSFPSLALSFWLPAACCRSCPAKVLEPDE